MRTCSRPKRRTSATLRGAQARRICASGSRARSLRADRVVTDGGCPRRLVLHHLRIQGRRAPAAPLSQLRGLGGEVPHDRRSRSGTCAERGAHAGGAEEGGAGVVNGKRSEAERAAAGGRGVKKEKRRATRSDGKTHRRDRKS